MNQTTKKYPGITPRGRKTIQIGFNFKGNWCRETIKVPVTPQSLKNAHRKREAIIYKISNGSFDYAEEFPNSKNAAKYSHKCTYTVGEYLLDRLEWVHKNCEYSTWKDYKNIICNQLIPEFGELKLDELKVKHVTDWLESIDDEKRIKEREKGEKERGLSIKRAINLLTPLRAVYKKAMYQEVVNENPLERLPELKEILGDKRTDYQVQPFLPDEQALLLSHMPEQTRNYYQFAFATGMRHSEIIALKWPDINMDEGTINIHNAIVEKRVKGPKTESGIRTIKLLQPALDALKNQMEYTRLENEFVFHNPKRNAPWQTANQLRRTAWIPAMEASEFKYRNPYQTRHTYASVMLTAGEDPMWVAAQMGHKDWGVIRNVYGKWMNDMRPDAGSKAESYLKGIALGGHD